MGRIVPGAEIRLTDAQGKLRSRVFSDLRGRYRFAALPSAASYAISAAHVRFRPIQPEHVARQTGLNSAAPFAAEAQAVSRDLQFSAESGARVDPNAAEHSYQQALLLLGRGELKSAVDLLKRYAQTGANQKQVGRALAWIAEYDR
jgi:hypothetical protein